MSEEQVQSTTPDPMDVPSGEVDMSYPLLQPDRLLKMEIRRPAKVPGKKEGTEVLLIPLVTTDDQTSTKGDLLHSGFKCTTRVALTPTKDYPQENVNKAVTRWMRSMGMPSDMRLRHFVDNIATLADNKVVVVKIGISPAKDGYPESNNFTPQVPN
jgi:hypothetical protein